MSRVLPLFTLAHAQAADCQVYWPEIFTNMPMADLGQPQPDDTRLPRLFGNVSPFDPQLFQSPDECADELIAERASGRYSPLEVAQWLESIAADAAIQLQIVRIQSGVSASSPGFRRAEEDILIQRGLALCFAAKIRSAVLWRLYVQTGHPGAGDAAIAHYVEGRDPWVTMATRAAGIYRSDITYGSERLRGHWLDRIPALDEDIGDLRRRRMAAHAPADPEDPGIAERAFRIASQRIVRPAVRVQHTPADSFSRSEARD